MATCIKDRTIHFPASAKGILSLFCMGQDAKQVTLRGLQYPMENGMLSSSFPLGVSNHFIGQPASISVGSGTLLALYDIENGFPSGECV